MKLRHLTFKVRPAVEHPMYWDLQFGFLSIWLFGFSDEDAIERAEKILEQLPFEIAGESGPSVRDCQPETGSNAVSCRRF